MPASPARARRPRPRLPLLLLTSLAVAAACGSPGTGPATVAEVEVVRPPVLLGGAGAVAGWERLSAGGVVTAEAGARALVRHDQSARALLDGGARVVVRDAGLSLEAGRLFLEATRGVHFTLSAADGVSVEAAGARIEASRVGEGLHIYVASGEAAYRLGRGEHGLLRAGERAELTPGGAKVSAEPLWDDWTGGLALAEASGRGADRSRGGADVGARRPGSLGEARFPLVITRLEVRTTIEDDLATTRVVETFFNPASDTLEGLYRLRVPEGAILSRFAIDRDGRWADGFVKERQTARAQYQAQVYEGSTKDPALLEWDAPGSYRARLYPLPPGASRKVLVEYTEWLLPRAGGAGGERSFRFPLAAGEGAPLIQELDLTVDATRSNATSLRAGMAARIEGLKASLALTDHRPRADFVVDLMGPARAASEGRGYRSPHTLLDRARARIASEDDYYLLRVVPLVGAPPTQRAPLDLVILTDVSAGTDATHLQLARTTVEALLRHLDPADRVAIAGADLDLHPPGAGGEAAAPALVPAADVAIGKVLDALARQGTGGATDLGATLTRAAGLLPADPARRGAVIYIGDALPTVGELDLKSLRERLDRLPVPLRLYGVAIGDDADLSLLSGLSQDGGLAQRVGDRAQAATASLRILAHAARRVLHRVTVSAGAGLDRTYPRRPISVVEGEPLELLARVRQAVPDKVTLSGLLDGKPWSESFRAPVRRIDGDDLRLRWAGQRLGQLLADGASAEEVAELGTRQNLITPFTSFYVPSADELSVIEQETSSKLAAGLGLGLALFGCSSERGAAPPPGARESRVAAPQRAGGRAAKARTIPGDPGEARDEGRMGGAGRGAALEDTAEHVAGALIPAPAAAPSAPPPAEAEAPMAAAMEQRNQAARSVAETQGVAGLGMIGSGAGGGGTGEGTIGLGGLGVPAKGARKADVALGLDGDANGHAMARADNKVVAKPPASTRFKDAVREMKRQRALDPEAGRSLALLSIAGDKDVLDDLTPAPLDEDDDPGEIWIRVNFRSHRPRRCSPASEQPLSDRLELWRERLSTNAGFDTALEVWQDAQQRCELRSWGDRRALLRAMLAAVAGTPGKLSLYQSLGEDPAAQEFLRKALLASARTPADLRLIADGLGLSEQVQWTLVEEMLARAKSPEERLRTLRQLQQRWAGDLRLRLKEMEALEALGQKDEARRVAELVQRAPNADAQARTAVGELFVRLGDLPAARRVFSEIVEFAPQDPVARRRLGDLYRAHGWFDEALRQYQTLLALSPGDPAVLLLQAAAAAGAGRTDEALRLEQRVAGATEPGAESGVARVATWWSTLRLALLRAEARDKHDAEELAKLGGRARRSNVEHEQLPLHAFLTWSHPEADCELWAQLPGAPLQPAIDVAPEFGIAQVASREPLGGPVLLEVRRPPGAVSSGLRYGAELVVILDENGRGEQLVRTPIELGPGRELVRLRIDGGKVEVLP